jgi:hypothetical protein
LTHCALLSWAQFPITASQINPVAGEIVSLKIADTTGVGFGSAGSGVSWDYSGLSLSQTASTSWVLPSTTTYGSSFPSANIAQTTPSSTFYLRADNNGYENWGIAQGSNTMIYTQPEIAWEYPINMNNTGSHPFSVTLDWSGYPGTRTGTANYTVDAYGTLIMPGFTLTNVVRIHCTVTTHEIINVSGTDYTTDYLTESYFWLKPGVKNFVLSIFTTTSNSMGIIQHSKGVRYVDASSLNIADNQLTEGNVYPNPANDLVRLSSENLNTGNYNVSIYALNGSCIAAYPARCETSGQITLDISSLNPGFYNLVLEGENNRISSRFIKQ